MAHRPLLQVFSGLQRHAAHPPPPLVRLLDLKHDPAMAQTIRPELAALLAPISKFKARSFETSLTSHIPLLQSCTPQAAASPSVVLLGDSMLERFITTGESPNLVSPWPSPTLLPGLPEGLGDESRLANVFNAGVGGDKIQNMAYRLLGDPENKLPSLAACIEQLKSVKVWVVHAGTNNLTPKRGLSDQDADALEMLLMAVLKIEGAPGLRARPKLIVTGIGYRKDVSDEMVDAANSKLERVVGKLNDLEEGKGRLSFFPAAQGLNKDEHLVDHVHLTLEGYRIWVRELFPEVLRTLKEMEDLEATTEGK